LRVDGMEWLAVFFVNEVVYEPTKVGLANQGGCIIRCVGNLAGEKF
jgi:hypothetical protein